MFQELEEALLTDGLEDTGSPLLVELTVRLVQGCLPGKAVNATNYQSYLRKLFKHKCQVSKPVCDALRQDKRQPRRPPLPRALFDILLRFAFEFLHEQLIYLSPTYICT